MPNRIAMMKDLSVGVGRSNVRQKEKVVREARTAGVDGHPDASLSYSKGWFRSKSWCSKTEGSFPKSTEMLGALA